MIKAGTRRIVIEKSEEELEEAPAEDSGRIDSLFGLKKNKNVEDGSEEDDGLYDSDKEGHGTLSCVACEPPDCQIKYECHNAVQVRYF